VLLAAVFAPLVFTMFVWVVVTAWRIWRPEKERPIEQSAERLRRLRLRSSVPLRVRLEDIRELERDRRERHQTIYDDLDVRRN